LSLRLGQEVQALLWRLIPASVRFRLATIIAVVSTLT